MPAPVYSTGVLLTAECVQEREWLCVCVCVCVRVCACACVCAYIYAAKMCENMCAVFVEVATFSH